MRIIFGLGHPAHFHLFKNIFKEFKVRNIEFKIFISDKDILSNLLIEEGYSFIKLTERKVNTSFLGKVGKVINTTFTLSKAIKEFKPTILAGCLPQLVYAGILNRKPTLFFGEDDFKITFIQGLSVYPFVSNIIAPIVTNIGPFQRKKIAHSSYHELAYLHPNNFSPDKQIIEKYFDSDDQYFILRFANLNAYHDIGKKGISESLAHKIIERLLPFGKVYITSEIDLSKDLEKYRIMINPKDMHHVMAFAKMYIGDSQTMAAEAAVLGIPFIRYNSFVGKIGYLKELEDVYNLGYGIQIGNEDLVLNKISEILEHESLEQEWLIKKTKMLNDKIDLSKFIIWFIEKYPESRKIMNENPDYQYKFK